MQYKSFKKSVFVCCSDDRDDGAAGSASEAAPADPTVAAGIPAPRRSGGPAGGHHCGAHHDAASHRLRRPRRSGTSGTLPP